MIYKMPEREVLNLLVGGKCVERFVVTRASWENFLQRLSEKESPATQRIGTHAEHLAIPSQI